MPRLGSWVRIPSPAPEKTARNQHQGCSSADEVPAPISLNEPRTVPNCLASLGKRRAKRSRKVRSPSSARASAPSSLIGAVGTHAASDIARAESKRPPGRPFDVFRLAKRRKTSCAHPLDRSNAKINDACAPAAQATHSFAPTAAQCSPPTAQAGGNAIAPTPAATKRAGRAILRFQRLPAGVVRQSHDQLKIDI